MVLALKTPEFNSIQLQSVGMKKAGNTKNLLEKKFARPPLQVDSSCADKRVDSRVLVEIFVHNWYITPEYAKLSSSNACTFDGLQVLPDFHCLSTCICAAGITLATPLVQQFLSNTFKAWAKTFKQIE